MAKAKSAAQVAINRCLAIVFLATAIDTLGVSLTIPVNVPYVRFLSLVTVQGASTSTARGTDDCSSNCDLSCVPAALPANVTPPACPQLPADPACATQVQKVDAASGLPFLVYNLGALIGVFWMPLFSDKYGRKTAVMVSIFGSLSGFILQATAADFTWLIAARGWGGLFGSTVSVSNAFIVELVPEKQRAAKFGQLIASVVSAFAVGPLIGSALLNLSIRAPFWGAAIMSFLAIFLCATYVKEPKELLAGLAKKHEDGTGQGPAIEMKQRGSLASLDDVKVEGESMQSAEPEGPPPQPLKECRVWLIILHKITATVAFTGFNLVVPIFLIREAKSLGVYDGTCEADKSKAVATWFGTLALVAVVLQLPVLVAIFPRCTKRIGLLGTGALGCFLLGVGIVLLTLWGKVGEFFISLPLVSLGNGLQQAVTAAFLSQYSTPATAAKTLAIGSLADSVGNLLGPLITQLVTVDAALPAYAASGSALLSCFTLLTIICCGSAAKPTAKPPTEELEQEVKKATPEEKAQFRKEAMAAMAAWLDATLEAKNLHYALEATNPIKRKGGVQLLQEAIDEALPFIPPPDEATKDAAFRAGFAAFFSAQGHTDWTNAIRDGLGDKEMEELFAKGSKALTVQAHNFI